MNSKVSIIWFRQDLRLHDNEALTDALRSSDVVVPLYVFDERTFKGKTKRFGFEKTGAHRAKFIIESVQNLKKNLQAKGSDLVIRVGKPEEIVAQVARELRAGFVFCNRERTQEEVDVQDALEQNLWSIGQELRFVRGKMLLHTADLPFPVTHTPDVFTQFRKEVEKIVPIRKPFPIPENGYSSINSLIDIGTVPSFSDLGIKSTPNTVESDFKFKGGEDAGLERVNTYFWETRAVSDYKDTRNYMLGVNYSSRFSAWLAQGCISPKFIYSQVKAYEEKFKGNESTYLIVFELIWRDFFRLMLKKHGDVIFQKGGTKREVRTDLVEDEKLLKIWTEGRTGIPIIDANMRELNTTGYMSNRGRQLVASFLINDLKISWQMGAEYFESMLIDYDPCSNYGNWNYIAGVGSDPRENRNFNILAQAKKYDPDGEYIRHWIPEIAMLPKDKVFNPESMDSATALDIGYRHGSAYPRPMIDSGRWS